MARAAAAPARPSTPAAPARPQRVPARRRPGAAIPPPRRPTPEDGRQRAAPRTATARSSARETPLSTGLVDRLLLDRGWIALVGLLLVGIVFLNVRLLVLDGGIARDAARTTQLKQANATLRLQAARLGSTERIQRVAAARGLVWPQPGRVRWLRPEARPDAREALARMTPPAPPAAGGGDVASTGAASQAPPAAGAGAATGAAGTTSTARAGEPAGSSPGATTPTATTTPASASAAPSTPIAARGAPDVSSPAG